MPRTQAPVQVRTSALQSYPARRVRNTKSPAESTKKPRITAAKVLRNAIQNPGVKNTPELLYVRTTARGRELIWESDPILDAYLEKTLA